MDDKKLLNGKFTFKSCVVQKKRASLLSENVNRQLAEIKVVGLPFIGNLTVTDHCFCNKRPDCYVPSKLEKEKLLSHGLTALKAESLFTWNVHFIILFCTALFGNVGFQ